MNDNKDLKDYQARLAKDKMVYRLVTICTILLIAFSIAYAYYGTQRAPKIVIEPPLPSSSVDIEDTQDGYKPLPDFVLDNVKPDELEKLKP